MEYTINAFGSLDGRPVDLITIKNSHGIELSVTNYGCIVTSLVVPDRHGHKANVVLGYKTFDNYLEGHPFFGAIAGRCANRIAKGQFSLDGESYQLETNELLTGQHLHGGARGFDKYIWGYDIESTDGAVMIHLHRVSPDGEAGYPGTLDVVHTIGLDNENQLHYNFRAHTDKPTVVNLVNHSYYNLAGDEYGPVTEQRLKICANHYTPVGEDMIPTGDILSVADSGLDFRKATSIGDNMEKMPAGAIDHNFVLDRKERRGEYHLAACLTDEHSGREMTLYTTQPGLQFYNGFKLSNKIWIGRNGNQYQAFEGLCLETQHFPDSPNQPHFPTVRLNPGEVYEHKTIHKFGICS